MPRRDSLCGISLMALAAAIVPPSIAIYEFDGGTIRVPADTVVTEMHLIDGIRSFRLHRDYWSTVSYEEWRRSVIGIEIFNGEMVEYKHARSA